MEFQSITQYDEQFDGLFENINNKGFTCSYFSFLTAWKFLADHPMNQYGHIETVKQSVTLSLCMGTVSHLFEQFVEEYTNINKNQILSTSTNLIEGGDTLFTDLFPCPENNSKYATIILKNERYFVVLVSNEGYFIRDCHEATQYNFETLDDLASHLISTYNFMETINIEGFDYSNYSSIEFLIINDIFETCVADRLDLNTGDNVEIEKSVKTNEKIDFTDAPNIVTKKVNKFVGTDYDYDYDYDYVDFE